MALKLQFKISLTDAVIHNAAAIESATRKTIVPAVIESTLLLERVTKLNFPIGATGIGRNSIESATTFLRGAIIRVEGNVFSPLNYPSFVERGTRPHWVPIRPLKLWAKRVLGDERLAYPVQRKIARLGTRAQRPFGRGLDTETSRIEGILRAAEQKWERFLNG